MNAGSRKLCKESPTYFETTLKESMMSRRESAVKEWVDSNFVTLDVSVPVEPSVRHTMIDSSDALKAGCDVQELDTIPMELMELLK
jgi:hypothetical protein